MILTAIVFFVILTVLVLIHEFGHFAVARFFGVRVEEFGLGLPPRVWGKKIGDTIYSINWLPIGGFVRLAGEDLEDKDRVSVPKAKQHEYFWAKSKKARTMILSAGVIMNLLLSIAITTGLLVKGVKEPTDRVHIESVVSESPADIAGVQSGDRIFAIGELNQPTTTESVISYTKEHAGKPISLTVIRNGRTITVSVTPRSNPPKGQGALGIAISTMEVHRYSALEAPKKAVVITFTRAFDMVTSLGSTAARLLTLRAPEAEVAGPIGIAQVTGQAVKFGWEAVLEFASILSLNLAVLNILPIPALDGGRVLFVVLEKVLRRKINPALERNAHQIGMIVLFALILLVSVNDILRLARGG